MKKVVFNPRHLGITLADKPAGIVRQAGDGYRLYSLTQCLLHTKPTLPELLALIGRDYRLVSFDNADQMLSWVCGTYAPPDEVLSSGCDDSCFYLVTKKDQPFGWIVKLDNRYQIITREQPNHVDSWSSVYSSLAELISSMRPPFNVYQLDSAQELWERLAK